MNPAAVNDGEVPVWTSIRIDARQVSASRTAGGGEVGGVLGNRRRRNTTGLAAGRGRGAEVQFDAQKQALADAQGLVILRAVRQPDLLQRQVGQGARVERRVEGLGHALQT